MLTVNSLQFAFCKGNNLFAQTHTQWTTIDQFSAEIFMASFNDLIVLQNQQNETNGTCIALLCNSIHINIWSKVLEHLRFWAIDHFIRFYAIAHNQNGMCKSIFRGFILNSVTQQYEHLDVLPLSLSAFFFFVLVWIQGVIKFYNSTVLLLKLK